MFESATLLTHDYLTNETTFRTNLQSKEEKQFFKEYYLNICAFIKKNFYCEPSISQIEEYLTNGSYEYDNLGEIEEIVCPIEDETGRKYLFRRAMAKQWQFDSQNGRGNMIAGVSQNMCEDTIETLKMLGLYKPRYWSN